MAAAARSPQARLGAAVAGLALAFLLGVGLAVPAGASAPSLPVELNRLEPVPAPAEGCRIWLVLANDAEDAAAVASLRLDLVVFGTDGQIARRVAVELGPIGAGRTAVRLFDLAGLPCDRLGRLLVNDVLGCRVGGQDQPDCADRLRPSSRVGIRFGL